MGTVELCNEVKEFITKIHKDKVGWRLLVVVNKVLLRSAYCERLSGLLFLLPLYYLRTLKICNARETRPFLKWVRGSHTTH